MTVLKIKQSGVWTPIAGDIAQVAPIPPEITGLVPGPWTAVTFQNGWTNYEPLRAAQYRKVGDEVQIRGLIAGGTVGAPAFTLPSGYYHTTRTQHFPVVSNNALAFIIVLNNGGIQPAGSSSPTWVELGTIRFSILQ